MDRKYSRVDCTFGEAFLEVVLAAILMGSNGERRGVKREALHQNNDVICWAVSMNLLIRQKMSAREEAEGPQGDLFARFLQRLHRRGTDQGWTGLNIKIKVTGLLKLLATLQAAVRSLRATPTYVRPL